MLLAQNHGVRDLEALTTSPNYGVNGGVNGDKSIYGGSQKVGRPKIMNGSKIEQIKMVPYELNLKVCSRTHLMPSNINRKLLLLFSISL